MVQDPIRAAVESFRTSGLFLTDFYLRAYPDVAQAKIDPLRHFLEVGWKEGRRPNPFFDPKWYVSRNSDVAASGINPLVHYWRFGEKENRQPCPLFEPDWYRSTYAPELGSASPLAHYLANRHLKRFSPNRYFDVAYYLEQNPDVAAAGVDPLEHFVTTGFREGRSPSQHFDLHFYVRKYLRSDNRDPLTHYFDVGRAFGCATFNDPNASTSASEIKKFTSKGAEFEELRGNIVGSVSRRAKVLAFYLPQFHSFPENDHWWGKGFTEWTNIVRGTPRFRGHYQPRVPRDFGFYDLSDPAVLRRQIDAAKAAGLYGFCFYYYNFNGKRLLDGPVDAFLNDRQSDFPFCLLWANENWTRRWDGAESEVLIRQDYRPSDASALIDDIARHFADTRYMRVKGRPLLLLYRPDIVPDVKNTIAHWRELFLSRHGEEPWILMAQAFDNDDPRIHGFDGAFEFPPHKIVKGLRMVNSECEPFDDSFTAQVYRYDDVVDAAISDNAPPFPLIRTVFPSWDNDARRQGHGLTVTGSSPKAYAKWLDHAIRYARQNPFCDQSLVFINAWNEWAEGAYLEPDLHFGGAYLNATARAIAGMDVSSDKRKIVLVGHDAFPAGAQLLLLHLARVLTKDFGLEVEIVLCDDGELASSYRDTVPTHIATGGPALRAQFQQLSDRGFKVAITNTVAAGAAIAPLTQTGFTIVSLVHEMPRIVAEKKLNASATAIATQSDVIVFPAEIVRNAFETGISRISRPAVIRPQGLYQTLSRVPDAKAILLQEFGLPQGTRIVLNIGYGDLRKGLDLFCAASQLVAAKNPDVVFVWVGRLDRSATAWLHDPDAFPHVRFVGQRNDVSTFLSAADVFALTSREDPYPSVVLEALSFGVPVIAFEGAGGISDLLTENELGELVPYANVSALSNAITGTLRRSPTQAQEAAVRSQDFASKNFSFDAYAFDLLRTVDPALARVSVIVPNFNYARYLHERLGSILGQSYPIFELIVLDDASTDDSLAVLDELRRNTQREIQVVANAQNSGNVFAQWTRGVELARGDLIWIAEADDIAAPNFLSRLVPSFCESDVKIAFCDSKAIDSAGNELSMSYKRYYSRVRAGALRDDEQIDAAGFAKVYLAQRNLILNVSSVLWRRNCLHDALALAKPELESLRLAGDWALYVSACSQGGSIFYCADKLNSHRRHSGGVTSGMAMQQQIGEIDRVHQYFNRVFGEDVGRLKLQADYVEELRAQAEQWVA